MSTLTKVADPAIDHFLTEHARVNAMLAGRAEPWLQQLRQQGLAQFAAHGLPTVRDEDWKYTNVSPIAKSFCQWSSPNNTTNLPTISPLPTDLTEHRLVFMNGHFAPQLSTLSTLPPSVQVTNLAQAISQQPQLIEPYLGQIADNQKSGFTALNTAFIHDGAFIYIPRNSTLTQPIQLLFLNTAQPTPSFNSIRNLIIIEDNSQASIIENYSQLESNLSFTNVVTEMIVGKHAIVEHYKLLREDKRQTFHIGTLQVQQQLHSQFTSHSFALGGALVRSDTNVVLAAEYTECILNGLYLTADKQHLDHHTVVDHIKPHSTSRESYKGVLADSSRAVFNGKVIIHPGAQKSNAKQSNRNLLLSNNAEIDTKPQLEVYNDDVRCTHGATVGQLSEDALFYLRARGIPETNARGILVYAFVREILERVPLISLRKQLADEIQQSMGY